MQILLGSEILKKRICPFFNTKCHIFYLDFALVTNYGEFPGGKLELGETPHCGLVRELDEEIGVHPLETMPLITVIHQYPEHCVRLNVFWVKTYKGVPFGKEGQSLVWCALNELNYYPLLPDNDIILKALENIYHFNR